MTFGKKPESPFVKTLRDRGGPARRRPFVPTLLLRSLAIGLFAIGAAVWALVRHYTHVLPPLRVPIHAAPAPTYDADAGEVPVPEIFEDELGRDGG